MNFIGHCLHLQQTKDLFENKNQTRHLCRIIIAGFNVLFLFFIALRTARRVCG